MTTQSTTISRSESGALAKSGAQAKSGLAAIFACALIGLSIISVVGHVQAAALHDAAHDVRHATGFPCH